MRVTLSDYDKIKERRARGGYPDAGAFGREEVPVDRYVNPAYVDLEKHRVFRRTWQIAGRVEQVAKPGMYFVHDMGDYSLLFDCGTDGQIRGFLNACRHRGCELAVDAGKADRFVCRYHAWTYDLAGRLIGVPEPASFPGLDKANYALKPISVDQWAGFVWFNIDTTAVPLKEYLGDISTHVDAFPWARQTTLYSKSWDVDCNWKLLLDNFNETYHVSFIHKNSSGPFMDWRNTTIEMAGLHTRLFNPYTYEGTGALIENPVTASEKVHNALDPAAREFVYNYHFFPNAFLYPVADYAMLARIYPLSVDRCRFRMDYLGFPPETEKERETLKERFAFYDVIFEEDFKFLPDVQRGVRSGALTSMPLGYLELAVRHFHHTLDQYLGETPVRA